MRASQDKAWKQRTYDVVRLRPSSDLRLREGHLSRAKRGRREGVRASDSGVPLVAAVLPESALAAAHIREGLDRLDPHHIFRHLVAELALDTQAQRGAMRDGQRRV